MAGDLIDADHVVPSRAPRRQASATSSQTAVSAGSIPPTMGPLAAILLRLFDNAIHGKVKAGFEMLVANFSLGILGGIMAIIGLLGVGPVVQALTNAAGAGVDFLIRTGLLPLASIVPVDIITLIGGAVLTETVFSWFGMGKLFVDSLQDQLQDPVMAYILIVGIFAVIANFVADLIYAVLDPRIRVAA